MIFFKFHTLLDIFKKLDYTFGYREAYVNLLEIFEMILCIFISAHIMTILYYLVAIIDIKYYDIENTWLVEYNIQN